MKNVVLLGATGSIGKSCLNVIRQNKEHFHLFGIGFGSNLDRAQEIAKEFNPDHIFVDQYQTDKSHIFWQDHSNTLSSEDELRGLIQDSSVDIVISAISGFAGLKASYFAIEAGKVILIANKESIVAAGDILMPLAKKKNSEIIPIDSEHNAIYQCLPLEKNLKEISKILITASGGPFREKPLRDLRRVSLNDAMNHPTWSMGAKITIDSATLINKCLELIEAHYLFNIPESQIEIVVHPQSIIHSMITFIDGSTIAQMSNPSMEVPISNALGMGKRLPINFTEIDFTELNLSFEPVAHDRKMIFDMAREVCNKKGNLGVIFNASNEIAVDAFINKNIDFVDIYEAIQRTFDCFTCSKINTIDEIFEYDKEARIQAEMVIKSLH